MYIYNILVITKKKFKEYINELDKVLQILTEAVLKVNSERSFSV